MTYTIDWAVEKRVIISTFIGDVTREDLMSYINQMREWVKQGEQPLYHISNSLELTKVHLSLGALLQLVRSVGIFGHLAWQIDVNLNPTNKMLAALSSQVIRIRTRTVPSMNDAVNFIKSIDITLANVEWNIPNRHLEVNNHVGE
ncbi:MAG: hypothetical protein CUN52_02340 [Phototrophicales bacterium]|nr:MAG: hypothetical protein CUN52_02340 [Phototrophicales bacterium]